MEYPMKEYTPSPLIKPSSQCNLVDVIPTVPEPSLIFDEGVSIAKEKKIYKHNIEEHFAKKYSASQNAACNSYQNHTVTYRKPDHNKPKKTDRNMAFRRYSAKENNNNLEKIQNMHPNFTPRFTHNIQRSRSHSTPYFVEKSPPIPKEKCSLSAENHDRTPQSHPNYAPVNPFNNLLNTPSFNYPQIPENQSVDQRVWMKKLPGEAYELLLQQNTQLLQLQNQVNNLLHSQKNESNDKGCQKEAAETVTVSTQTECQENEKEFASIGINTDVFEAENVEEHIEMQKESQPSKEIPQTDVTPELEIPPIPIQSIESSLCVPSNDSTDKFAGWESESFNIEVQTFETQNNQSIASSLRAVDIPVLDSSMDHSKSILEMTNVNSPVLGESASMCQLPTEKPNTQEDKQFFGNLLNQVQNMLKDAGIDIESRCSGEDLTDQEQKKSYKKKVDDSDRIYTSTKKQLKKLGVSVDWNNKENLQRKHFVPQTVISPELLKLESVTNRRLLEKQSSFLHSDRLSDLSMHANAIALKYLSSEQKTPELSLKKKITFSVPPPDNLNKVKSTNSTAMMPGMSLISPCNMSLATRTYMKKYGLIEGEESSSEEEDEPITEEPPKTCDSPKRISRDFCKNSPPEREKSSQQFFEVSKPEKETPFLPTSNQEGTETRQEMPSNLSQLKVNLGVTLDMLLPFLEDLENKQQRSPSQQTSNSGESRKVYNPNAYDSKLSCDNSKLSVYDSGVVENSDQILSPRVLNQFAQNSRDLTGSKRNYIPSRSNLQRKTDEELYFSDPQQSFLSDNPVRFTHNSHSKVFSSLKREKYNSDHKPNPPQRKYSNSATSRDFDPVLDFNIAQAFNKNRISLLPQNSN